MYFCSADILKGKHRESRNVETVFAAHDLAKRLGGSLSESGAPRGERRIYTLTLPGVVDYASSKLAEIERRLAVASQQPK